MKNKEIEVALHEIEEVYQILSEAKKKELKLVSEFTLLCSLGRVSVLTLNELEQLQNKLKIAINRLKEI
jgi:hypothetical protein